MRRGIIDALRDLALFFGLGLFAITLVGILACLFYWVATAKLVVRFWMSP